MQIRKNLLKKDVEDLKIKELIEENKIENINGDWIRITDYFSFNESTISLLASKYKENYGTLAPTISLAFLIYGLGLEKREKYMKEEKDWEYVKKVIGKFPFEEYYDYEKRIYPLNIKTLKIMGKDKYIKLTENDFIHLQTWVLAVYLGRLEERNIRFTPLRDNGILVSLSIKGNKKDIEQVNEEMRKTYEIIFDLNVGWFMYS